MRVGVVRMPPLGIAAFLRALAIEPRQIRPRRRLDARRLRQSRQKLPVRLARIAAHDAPQRRVRLQRGRIDSDGLSLDEFGGGQDLQDPREDRAVRLHIDQTPCPRDRGVLGRRLIETQAEEASQRERIRRPPGNRGVRLGLND
jgi:hypothetical protein